MFITLEGGEGAGKSTQARMLAEALRRTGRSVLLTREPGGAPGAEALRTLLLGGAYDWSAPAETLLHFAARAEHVERTIRPALERGEIVVCDRFADSTLAYQGYGQGADLTAIRTLTALVGLRPDLTLVLHVSPNSAASRLAHRNLAPDRYEALGAAFHARVDAAFRDIAAADPARYVAVDADGTIDAVHRAIWDAVEPRMRAAA